MTPSLPQPVKQWAERLVELAEAMDAFADRHTEHLDFESYASLAEHAAELKAIARLLSANDMAAEVVRVLGWAEDHLAVMRQLHEGGAS